MAKSIEIKGNHSWTKKMNLQPPNMSTCQMTDCVEFCKRFDTELKKETKNKDDAIDKYSYFIREGESCLNVIQDSSQKEQLRQQLALGYNERGMAKYQKVDFDDAIDDFTNALNYDQSLHMTFYNRGLIHYRLGRFDEAITDMKKSLELQPNFDSAQECLKQAQTDKQIKR